MRNIIFLFILALTGSCNALQAQSYRRFDTAFITSFYNNFFQRNPSLRFLTIRADKLNLVSVQVVSKDRSGKFYDLQFEGDRYFFNKEYGDLKYPTQFLSLLSTKVCKGLWYTYFRIQPDTLIAELQYFCNESSDDLFFTKVENNIYFEGDQSRPEIMIQQALFNTSFKDSVYMLQAMVDREGKMHASQVLHGNDTTVTNLIFLTIEQISGWKPAIQGGRTVKAYSRIFVRVLPDRKIRVWFEHLKQ